MNELRGKNVPSGWQEKLWQLGKWQRGCFSRGQIIWQRRGVLKRSGMRTRFPRQKEAVYLVNVNWDFLNGCSHHFREVQVAISWPKNGFSIVPFFHSQRWIPGYFSPTMGGGLRQTFFYRFSGCRCCFFCTPGPLKSMTIAHWIRNFYHF